MANQKGSGCSRSKRLAESRKRKMEGKQEVINQDERDEKRARKVECEVKEKTTGEE